MPICYCKTGVMSQCEAAGCFTDQQCCCYYRRASKTLGVLRCMYLNPNLNNHCWHPGAQRIAAGFNDVAPETDDTTLEEAIELEIDNMRQEKDGPRQYCLSCMHYPCADVKTTERNNKVRHLSENELWDLGTGCAAYLDRVQYQASINSTKGGATP